MEKEDFVLSILPDTRHITCTLNIAQHKKTQGISSHCLQEHLNGNLLGNEEKKTFSCSVKG
ncbi:CLUMA_CG019392, isoform A [Clunio marinus]|uniref:CLUMA_CG019392, isoform A n=1 Tax=Clunio marinus TaxID=568069 RepID=A0A1J1J4G9_9DIPT|nr:CLUMA_CG019392, isoform A [Clunio marinus]